MNLSNVKIGTKLYGGFLIVTVIFSIAVVFALIKMGSLAKLQDEGASRGRDTIAIHEIQVEIGNVYADIADGIINRDITKTRKSLEKGKVNQEKNIASVKALADTKEEKDWAEEIATHYNKYIDIFEKQLMPVLDKGEGADMKQIKVIDEEIDGVRNSLIEVLEKFSNSLQKENEEADKLYDDTRQEVITIMIILSLIALIMAAFIAYFITNAITLPINEAVVVANELAGGNLTVDISVKGTDEAGQLLIAMKHMLENLKNIVTEITNGAGNIASASEELSSTAQQIAQGSSEQASSAEETSSSMEEMAANIKQNADNANQTEKIAIKAAADAKEGGKSVEGTVTAMKQIATKISIIEEIARQTNMLALNAAIEAARAGEHGKGFAVVAAEVRSLAERSQTAAQEISKLSTQSVEVAERAGEMLIRMVPDIQKTAELIMEISGASNEQNTGVDQINRAMQQLDQVIQQNSAASEQMSSNSEELSAQAEQLQDIISFFKLDGDRRSPKKMNISQPKTLHVKKGDGREIKVNSHKAITAKAGIGKGVNLDLSGADSEDGDYVRF